MKVKERNECEGTVCNAWPHTRSFRYRVTLNDNMKGSR